MAKNPSLTVEVDDQDFQRFTQSFNAFIDQLKKMTEQWKKISESIDKSAKSTQALNTTLSSLWQNVNKVRDSSHKITKEIFKWGTLITGIGALLGGGALFGMNRIANTVMEQRKRLLGLGGGDYGQMRAVETFGKSLLDDPDAALANIAKGKFGLGTKQGLALSMAGISEKDIKEKSASELLLDYLKRTEQYLKTIKDPQMVMPSAQARNITSMISEAEIIRLHGPQSHQFLEDVEKNVKAQRGRLTDADLQAWDRFWQAIRNYGLTIETEWMKQLSPLAAAMAKVSEGFANVTSAFIDMPVIAAGIHKLAGWMDWFGTFLSKDETKKALEDFLKRISFGASGYREWQEQQGLVPHDAPPSLFQRYENWLFNKPSASAAPRAPTSGPAAPTTGPSAWQSFTAESNNNSDCQHLRQLEVALVLLCPFQWGLGLHSFQLPHRSHPRTASRLLLIGWFLHWGHRGVRCEG